MNTRRAGREEKGTTQVEQYAAKSTKNVKGTAQKKKMSKHAPKESRRVERADDCASGLDS